MASGQIFRLVFLLIEQRADRAVTGVAQLVPPKLEPSRSWRLPGAATAGTSWSACGLVGFLRELTTTMASLQRSPSPSLSDVADAEEVVALARGERVDAPRCPPR